MAISDCGCSGPRNRTTTQVSRLSKLTLCCSLCIEIMCRFMHFFYGSDDDKFTASTLNRITPNCCHHMYPSTFRASNLHSTGIFLTSSISFLLLFPPKIPMFILPFLNRIPFILMLVKRSISYSSQYVKPIYFNILYIDY